MTMWQCKWTLTCFCVSAGVIWLCVYFNVCIFYFFIFSHAPNGICVCFQGSAGPPGLQGPRGLTGQKGSKGDSVCFFLPLFIYIACKLFCFHFVKCVHCLSMNVFPWPGLFVGLCCRVRVLRVNQAPKETPETLVIGYEMLSLIYFMLILTFLLIFLSFVDFCFRVHEDFLVKLEVR